MAVWHLESKLISNTIASPKLEGQAPSARVPAGLHFAHPQPIEVTPYSALNEKEPY